jgi:hypothetical protein
MIKATTILIVAAALVFVITGCEHKAGEANNCIAGPGGSTMVVVYAKHDTTDLPNYYTHPDTAYVKYGTIVSPGTSSADFDTCFIGEPGEDHIHCMGMKCGDYYIYRTAWDSVAQLTRYGGYGISFTDTSGVKEIVIAVN